MLTTLLFQGGGGGAVADAGRNINPMIKSAGRMMSRGVRAIIPFIFVLVV